jgi:hypothetical protein
MGCPYGRAIALRGRADLGEGLDLDEEHVHVCRGHSDVCPAGCVVASTAPRCSEGPRALSGGGKSTHATTYSTSNIVIGTSHQRDWVPFDACTRRTTDTVEDDSLKVVARWRNLPPGPVKARRHHTPSQRTRLRWDSEGW